MKTTIFSILVILVIFPAMSFEEQLRKIKIAWEDEPKPPYLYLDKDLNPTGVIFDIITEIAARKKISIENTTLPWRRCLYLLKEGKVDIVPNASYNESRTEFGHFSDLIYKTNLALFYSQEIFENPPKIKSLVDMKKYTFGGIRGFNYSFYDTKLKIIKRARSRANLIEMLRIKRFDFAIAQREVILAMKKGKEIDLTNIKFILDPVQKSKNYHILVNRNGSNSKEILDTINQGIKTITKDGTYKKIFSKYLPEDE